MAQHSFQLILWQGIAVLLQAALATACAGSSAPTPALDPTIFFPRQKSVEGERDVATAEISGQLVVVDGCLHLNTHDGNTSYAVIWPPDFTLRITGNLIEVLDHTGRVAARVGDEIYMGGGETQSIEGVGAVDEPLQRELPTKCGGPYWLVGEEVKPFKVKPERPASFEGGGPIDGEKVSMDVAQARLPWTIPLPTFQIGNTQLGEVWVSHEDIAPQERQVYLIYANGLEISIWPEAQSPDFSSWEAPFHAVKVKGISGVGTEPGVQKIEDEEQKYPGSITWWQNGLVINIYGDFPLAELLKVAESMPEPVWTQ